MIIFLIFIILIIQYNNVDNSLILSLILNKTIKNNENENNNFTTYIKINYLINTPIYVSSIIGNINTKIVNNSINNLIMVPFFNNLNCMDINSDIYIDCFNYIKLIKNNNYDYIWLKFEKKDKTSFKNNYYITIFDISSIFNDFYFDNDINNQTYIHKNTNSLVIRNLNETHNNQLQISINTYKKSILLNEIFNNIDYNNCNNNILNNYTLFTININITNTNIDINNIYFKMKIINK